MTIYYFTEDLRNNFMEWIEREATKENAEWLSSIMKQRHPDVDSRVIRKHCYEWIGYEENEKELDN